jgi:threonine synthase
VKLCTTYDPKSVFSLRDAVLQGLAPDGSLFVPKSLDPLPKHFFDRLPSLSLPEISIAICNHLFPSLSNKVIEEIITQSITFPAPVVQLTESLSVLELFHGPTLAFKDFGARFMAQLTSYYNRAESQKLIILVATSGDTGGAVASGFHKVPGIEVVILFPKNKVSAIQQKQLTTLGDNIKALEINGTFDDCQLLVKEAFQDHLLSERLRLTSANSINIARLIPQSFYYFEGYRQLTTLTNSVCFSVPSGNFGNLTAGLIAKRIGLPVLQFIAATNVNDVVPQYLKSSRYHPRSSIQTLSNAMDVGNPSNFDRMLHLYGSTWNDIRKDIQGYSFDDQQTIDAIREVYLEYSYLLDPHGAVGYLASQEFSRDNDASVIFLETAHPSKFLETVNKATGKEWDLHPTLQKLSNQQETYTSLEKNFSGLRSFLLDSFL